MYRFFYGGGGVHIYFNLKKISITKKKIKLYIETFHIIIDADFQ